MVHCDELIPQRDVRRVKIGQSTDDVANPHILPAISLLVDDKQPRVMSADARANS